MLKDVGGLKSNRFMFSYNTLIFPLIVLYMTPRDDGQLQCKDKVRVDQICL